MKVPARGEIWSIDLNPVSGHGQAGRQPCLVISDDIYNSGPAEKHIVVPVTSKVSAQVGMTIPSVGLPCLL